MDRREKCGLGHELVAKVKAAAGARVGARSRSETTGRSAVFDHLLSTPGTIVGIGASTGGVEALQTLLTGLPANVPAMLITQHMPAASRRRSPCVSTNVARCHCRKRTMA